jgi:hypothetical protein
VNFFEVLKGKGGKRRPAAKPASADSNEVGPQQ